jgi:hypothetical protein
LQTSPLEEEDVRGSTATSKIEIWNLKGGGFLQSTNSSYITCLEIEFSMQRHIHMHKKTTYFNIPHVEKKGNAT